MNNTRIREINSNFMNTVKYKDVSPVSFANAVVEVSGSTFSHSFRFALDAYHQIVKFLIDSNNFGSIVMSNIGNYAIKKCMLQLIHIQADVQSLLYGTQMEQIIQIILISQINIMNFLHKPLRRTCNS